jgi:hypothetical protein
VTRVRVGRAVAAIAALCAACQGSRIPAADVPDAPIAFSYRTQEEARQRADDWKDAREKETERLRGQVLDPDTVGTEGGEIRARANQVRDFFGRMMGRGDEGVDQHPGRLALLEPRTGAIHLVEGARRGSVPLAWSNDRTRLLFAQPGDRDYQILELERASGTVRPITHGPLAHTQACYASEGRIVVVTVEAQGARSRLEVSRPGGGGPFEPLTEWGVEHSPTCAPDGNALAWERDDATTGRGDLLLLAPIAPGTPRLLSPGRGPRYSPDGAWIVFSAPLQGGYRIWRMRADGSGRAPIGRGQRNESRPSVSPDGRFVVYVAAEAPPRQNLYLRRFDGSGDRILFADGDGEHPVW